MAKFLKIFVVITLLTIIKSMPTIPSTSAQTSTELPPFAAVTDGNLYLYNFADEPIQVTNFEDVIFNDIAFSPDGETIVFSLSTDMDTSELGGIWKTDITGSPPIKLANATAYSNLDFPLYFEDASHLLTVSEADEFQNPIQNVMYDSEVPYTPYSVFRISLDDNDAPQPIVSFAYTTGCGGAITTWDYAEFLEMGRWSKRPILSETEQGVLVTAICGGEGVVHVPLDTFEAFRVGWLIRPQLSPDRQQVIGIEIDPDKRYTFQIEPQPIVLIDLTTGEHTVLVDPLAPETLSTYEQVIWGADDSIYYSVRTQTGTISLTEDERESLQFDNLPVIDIPIYSVSITRLDLNTLSTTEIFSREALNVGRMAQHNDMLYFSLIPNPNSLVGALLNGELESDRPLWSGEAGDLRYFVPSLYRVPINSGDAELIAENVGLFTLHHID